MFQRKKVKNFNITAKKIGKEGRFKDVCEFSVNKGESFLFEERRAPLFLIALLQKRQNVV